MTTLVLVTHPALHGHLNTRSRCRFLRSTERQDDSVLPTTTSKLCGEMGAQHEPQCSHSSRSSLYEFTPMVGGV
ncbi:unnamed protein product [Lota lota]